MFTDSVPTFPAAYNAIWQASQAVSFSMPSDGQTGALLRALVATKPGANVLELGTGTGLAAAWLLDGMDATATLVSVDNDATYQAIAEQHLGSDARLQLVCADAAAWLNETETPFDLIFADAWPGKYSHLDVALGLLKPGGLYVIDDMLPQPNWPAGHEDNVVNLVAELEAKPGYYVVKLACSTGLMLVTKQTHKQSA